MHREHHGRRGAAPSEVVAGGGYRLERDPAAVQLSRDVRGQGARVPEGADGLDGEARVSIDLVGVRCRHVVGDLANASDELLISVHRHAHAASACRSSVTAAAIAAMLSNMLRLSIESGNSISKVSSSASITLTLA